MFNNLWLCFQKNAISVYKDKSDKNNRYKIYYNGYLIGFSCHRNKAITRAQVMASKLPA